MDGGHEFKLGDTLNVGVLAEITTVDVTGTTKGRGFPAPSSVTANTAAPTPTARRTCA